MLVGLISSFLFALIEIDKGPVHYAHSSGGRKIPREIPVPRVSGTSFVQILNGLKNDVDLCAYFIGFQHISNLVGYLIRRERRIKFLDAIFR